MSLESLDYEVHTAFDSKDAMLQLTGDTYDPIVTDLKMPGIDGIELLKMAIAIVPKLSTNYLSNKIVTSDKSDRFSQITTFKANKFSTEILAKLLT